MSNPERPRCAHCGEVLGVYEPLVVREAGATRRTSLAAEPGLVQPVREREFLHPACAQSAGRAYGA